MKTRGNKEITGAIIHGKSVYQSSIKANVVASNACTIDLNDGNMQTLDLAAATGNVTVTLTNGQPGQYSLIIKQHATTPVAITFSPTIETKWSIANIGITESSVIDIKYDGTTYRSDSSSTPVEDHDTTKNYGIGALVIESGTLYRANVNVSAGAFAAANWTAMSGGSGGSDNNYTNADKAKVDNLPADTNAALSGKVDTDGSKVLSDNNYTNAEQQKVTDLLVEGLSNTGATLLFDNTIGRFYQVDSPVSSAITLDVTDARIGGRATIFHRSSSAPSITGGTLFSNGTYNNDNTTINKIEFEFLGGTSFSVKYTSVNQINPSTNDEFDYASFNLAGYWRASDGVFSGTDVTSLTDLSGNGNSLIPVGTGAPQTVASGINGRPSIRFDGANGLQFTGALAGISDLSKRAGWIVFKLEDANGVVYHSVVIQGANSYTSTGTNTTMHLYNLNGTNNFNFNFGSGSASLHRVHSDAQLASHSFLFIKNTNDCSTYLDGETTGITNSGTQNVQNQGIYIGVWNGRGAKMLFAEFGLINNDTNTLSVAQIATLNAYFKAKYNIKPPVVVHNEGVGGNTTADVIARLSSINAHNAPLVDILIGVNDWRVPVAASRLTPAQYQTNLTTIVQSLKANGSQVVIKSIPPILQSESDYVCAQAGQSTGCTVNPLGDPYRTAAQAVATAENVFFHDLNQEFITAGQPTTDASSYVQHAGPSVPSDGNADGVHLSNAGAQFVAQKSFEFYQANNIDPSSVVCVGDSNTYGDGLSGAGTATGNTWPARLLVLLNQ